MNSETVILLCNRCGAKNKVPKDRLRERPICGKCRAPLSHSHSFPNYPVEVSDRTFKDEILDFPGPVLLEFYAPWCGHCQRLSPVLDQLASEYANRAKIAKLNVDQNSITASQYAIRSTPSLFFFKGGKLLDRALGALPRGEIERHLLAIL